MKLRLILDEDSYYLVQKRDGWFDGWETLCATRSLETAQDNFDKTTQELKNKKEMKVIKQITI